jgi:hypothetical protein
VENDTLKMVLEPSSPLRLVPLQLIPATRRGVVRRGLLTVVGSE